MPCCLFALPTCTHFNDLYSQQLPAVILKSYGLYLATRTEEFQLCQLVQLCLALELPTLWKAYCLYIIAANKGTFHTNDTQILCQAFIST